MISYEDALKTVEQMAVTVSVEEIGLQHSTGRFLAQDVFSDMDMPPFHKSAVDGFACRKEDIAGELIVVETIPAGIYPTKRLQSGECARIMTGAPVPVDADTVIMVEDIEYTGEERIRYVKDTSKSNICYRGEDVKEGIKVLTAGTRIKPSHVAVLASVGCASPVVYRAINVGIISTGNEIVEPAMKPAPSQIRNSNAYQLSSQVQLAGAIPRYLGIAADDPESTRTLISEGLSSCDIVLLTGGVSMGDFDYVPQVLEDAGVDILFKSISVQPGRPTVFGTKDRCYVFGLPGNPVSVFVQFELLVKPLIYRLSGSQYTPPAIWLPLGIDYQRYKSERMSIVPVKINEKGGVFPVGYHGSAHINALTEAAGLICVEEGITSLKKGALVHVRQI